MKLLLKPHARGTVPAWPWVGVGLMILAVGAGVIQLFPGLPLPVCGFKAATGHPCPACGFTHMLDSLLHGHLTQAYVTNPFFFIAIAVLVAWVVVGFAARLAGQDLFVDLPTGQRKWVWIAAITGLLCSWLFLWRAG